MFIIYVILIFISWIWLCSVKKYVVSIHDHRVDFTKWNDIFKGVSVVSGFMTVLVFQFFNRQNHWGCCVWGMVAEVIRLIVDRIGIDLKPSVIIYLISSFILLKLKTAIICRFMDLWILSFLFSMMYQVLESSKQMYMHNEKFHSWMDSHDTVAASPRY